MVFGQSFQFRVFPGGAHIAEPRWMLARGTLGSGWTRGVSFRPFPSSSSWWGLISSIFLIRISCHKTTRANGYYGAWPGWAVSISMLPLTLAIPKNISRGQMRILPQPSSPGTLTEFHSPSGCPNTLFCHQVSCGIARLPQTIR